jgi:hypothetical protein
MLFLAHKNFKWQKIINPIYNCCDSTHYLKFLWAKNSLLFTVRIRPSIF